MCRKSKMKPIPIIVCFRQDLRLQDNPALNAAAVSGRPILPVFVLEDHPQWNWGGASRWWLHHSLQTLEKNLSQLGLPLVLKQGNVFQALSQVRRETGADRVFWNRRHEPHLTLIDQNIQEALEADGCQVDVFEASLLGQPTDLKTGQGGAYQVFTPYYKKFRHSRVVALPETLSEAICCPADISDSLPLEGLGLLPEIPWDQGLKDSWQPGEEGARQAWSSFLEQRLDAYDERRDFPAVAGSSLLSAHLHWGEISPRQIWHEGLSSGPKAEPFLRQLVWREFAHHLLVHFPRTPTEPLREKFESFSWDGDPGLLTAWQKGETGYPLVDAGMRQLWHTGWMHNRVRMVAGSFLVKHLLLPWQEGAHWFWDTLVDANLANNTFGWQWTAGCGADAAPYFRIFNPVAQGKRFDKSGQYIRRWVPELKDLPDKLVHEPWLVGSSVGEHLGFKLGRDYPSPVVDHKWARERALETFRRLPKF